MNPPTGEPAPAPGAFGRPAAHGVDLEELTRAWLGRWSRVPPVAELLAQARPDRVVRLRGAGAGSGPPGRSGGRAPAGSRAPARAGGGTGSPPGQPAGAGQPAGVGPPAGTGPAAGPGQPAGAGQPGGPGVTEYRDMLRRCNAVLDRLFGGREVYVVSGNYVDLDEPAAVPPLLAGLLPGAVHWLRLLGRDAHAYHDRALDLFTARRGWRAGSLDRLLLAAATGLATNTMIMDTRLHRIVHPHRAGADVLLTGPAERAELRLDYPGWLVPLPR